MSRIFVLSICCVLASTHAQANYADQANNIEYQGDGLPQEATLDGKITKLDDLSPIIFLNRTKAALNCAEGSMQIELKFNDKFYGIAYADFDRNSACQVAGKGDLSYKLELPLKGCGTKQDPQRVFTNNIVVRFHPGLEMDGDEIITVVCRYPPPIAPVPPLPLPIQEPIIPASPLEPPLKGFQILLIICGILFLSLLLLGLGVSYYCLRRRPVTVIRPFSTLGSDSEITKLSGSSLGSLTMFEGLKIPRAHAPVGITGSSSGSDEGHLISDTLPSDYPSESHSEVEETRSLPVSSAGSFENRAFIHETSSFYSETYGHTQEQQVQNAVATTVPRLPLAVKEQVKVKKPPAPSPPSLSDTESLRGRDLSTIPEQREESIRSISPPPPERTHFTYVPELHPPPKHIQPAPTFNRILRRQQEMEPIRVGPARSIVSLNTEMTETRSITETIDDSHHIFVAPVPPPPPPIVPKQEYLLEMDEEHVSIEPPIAVVHKKPEITSHVVDDVFLRTITEKKTIEDIERHKRLITEYHTRAKPPPQVETQPWHSTTLTIPVKPDTPQWETFSEASSAPLPERITADLLPQSQIEDDKLPLNSPELVGNIGQSPPRHIVTTDITATDNARDLTQRSYYSSFTIPIKNPSPPPKTYLSTFNLPVVNPEVPNWDVLTKVFKPLEQEEEGPVIESAETFNAQLTMTDKIKWRQIITTESTLRTLLTEAVVREDFERIRRDVRYENIFEPPKWDTIIRILSPDPKSKQRYKKKSDWDTRSRRSSLPTLYEYDSDGGSSVRTLTREPMVYPSIPRRFSRSSYRSEADLRSMSEMIVDFRRPDPGDSQSETSSYYPERRYYDDSEIDTRSSHRSLARSLSQPSLARSASEFTERWVAPSVRYDTASEFTTPEGTPKSQRSSRIMPYSLPQLPRDGGERNSSWQATESRRMTHGPGTSTQEVTREYRSEATTSFMGRPPKNWFTDNESEASFK